MKQRREIPASFFFFGLVSKYEFHSLIIVDTWKSNENNGG